MRTPVAFHCRLLSYEFTVIGIVNHVQHPLGRSPEYSSTDEAYYCCHKSPSPRQSIIDYRSEIASATRANERTRTSRSSRRVDSPPRHKQAQCKRNESFVTRISLAERGKNYLYSEFSAFRVSPPNAPDQKSNFNAGKKKKNFINSTICITVMRMEKTKNKNKLTVVTLMRTEKRNTKKKIDSRCHSNENRKKNTHTQTL